MIDVAVVGAGEYVSGLSPNPKSDKTRGVIALTLFHLRSRGLVDSITICARDPKKRSVLEEHFRSGLAEPYQLNTSFSYRPQKKRNERAWETLLAEMKPGSAVIVVTPDSLHYEIAKCALEHDLHVLVAKPIVETLKQHTDLLALSKLRRLRFRGEYHKRYDPLYQDALLRAARLGRFNFFSSFMSQPKTQLETFRSWAGLSADISGYLNSHHIDLHAQMVGDRYRPVQVTANSSTGIGRRILNREIDDTISLAVTWETPCGSERGIANYVASWVAVPSDVHSQQRFFFSAEKGEIRIDQAHRGYTLAEEKSGFCSPNPLFMQYEPRNGLFAGQHGYGYKSIEDFLSCCGSEDRTVQDHKDLFVTAILEAGRISLGEGSKPIAIAYNPLKPYEPVAVTRE